MAGPHLRIVAYKWCCGQWCGPLLIRAAALVCDVYAGVNWRDIDTCTEETPSCAFVFTALSLTRAQQGSERAAWSSGGGSDLTQDMLTFAHAPSHTCPVPDTLHPTCALPQTCSFPHTPSPRHAPSTCALPQTCSIPHMLHLTQAPSHTYALPHTCAHCAHPMLAAGGKEGGDAVLDNAAVIEAHLSRCVHRMGDRTTVVTLPGCPPPSVPAPADGSRLDDALQVGVGTAVL